MKKDAIHDCVECAGKGVDLKYWILVVMFICFSIGDIYIFDDLKEKLTKSEQTVSQLKQEMASMCKCQDIAQDFTAVSFKRAMKYKTMRSYE